MALEKEIKYFEEMKGDLLAKYKGKYALIKDSELVDTFTNSEEAYQEGVKRFGKAEFLVKHIIENDPQDFVPSLAIGNIHAHT